jgi:flagellar biosynthetic protein FliQ
MNDQIVVDLAQRALMVALYIAGPMLIAALVVGLAVSVLQSLTQIQEQTLSFLPKLLVVGAIFLLMLPWMLRLMAQFTTELLTSLPGLVT